MLDYNMDHWKPQKYTAVIKVTARPMTRGEYVIMRGWELPADENGDDVGMLTVNINKPENVEGAGGYLSWLPMNVFNESYVKDEA